jgi:hypothetical protein
VLEMVEMCCKRLCLMVPPPGSEQLVGRSITEENSSSSSVEGLTEVAF